MSRSLWCAVAGLIGVSCLVLRRLLVVVTVHGESMRPTYAAGDTLLGVRWCRPGRGRSIVFRPPGSIPNSASPSVAAGPTEPPYRVKRVIALNGDPTPAWVRGQAAGSPVPAGCLVVRGDSDDSEDSRHYGYVRERDVLAVIIGRMR